MVQTLHDEHELIVDYLRRDAEAKHAAGAGRDRATSAGSAVEDRPTKARLVSAEKAAQRLPPKPAPEKTIVARDPEPLAPVLVVTATPLPPAEPAAAKVARSVGVVEAARDWVVNVSALPGRALALRLFDDNPTRPLPGPVSGLPLTHQD